MMELKLHEARAPKCVRTRRTSVILAALLLTLLLGGCGPFTFSPAAADYEADVAQAWFDLSLELVQKTAGFTPPVASRAFGYLGVTLYETVRPGMFAYRSMEGQLNELWDLPKVQWLARYHFGRPQSTRHWRR